MNARRFDSRNLHSHSPFLTSEGNILTFPTSRLPYIASCLAYFGFPFTVSHPNVIVSITFNPFESNNNNGGETLVDGDQLDNVKKRLLQELRAFSLRQFDYETWLSSVAACNLVSTIPLISNILESQHSPLHYNPLLSPTIQILPLLSAEVMTLRNAIKEKLWYCKPFSPNLQLQLQNIAARLHPHIRQICEEGSGFCFFRLSSHSPKDVPSLPFSNCFILSYFIELSSFFRNSFFFSSFSGSY
jgi:hypothetical protein